VGSTQWGGERLFAAFFVMGKPFLAAVVDIRRQAW